MIQGLTHPNRQLLAAIKLWKRRGTISATLGTNWVERCFVLTDNALFWFSLTSPPLTSQQGRVELRHIQSIRPHEASGNATSVDGLQSVGPRFLLEINHIMSDQPVLVGGTDAGMRNAWQQELERAVAKTGSPPSNRGDDSAGADYSSGSGSTHRSSLLRLELTGVTAMGTMSKAREALKGVVMGGRWSNRLLVLTDTHLYFYKQSRRRVDQARRGRGREGGEEMERERVRERGGGGGRRRIRLPTQLHLALTRRAWS